MPNACFGGWEVLLADQIIDKSFSSLQATLALAGYSLTRSGNAFLVSRWDRRRELADIDAVERFCRIVGVRARPAEEVRHG